MLDETHTWQIAPPSNLNKPQVEACYYHQEMAKPKKIRRGERDLTESQEETMRLLEDGANRTLETAPAPAASPRLAIARSQKVGARVWEF